jgi:glutamate synthase (NADPH) small chain
LRNNHLFKVKMPEQDPMVRNQNFLEVTTGYSESMAVEEANRCYQCENKPCVNGCPVNVKIPEFIDLVSQKRFEEAYLKIIETNNLPGICGRVCPQETQCEAKCIRGIKGEPVAIGRLERYCADFCKEFSKKTEVANIKIKDLRVAIVGSGPAGLTCAADLARLGYQVTIFEAFHSPGGVLMYGIPEFRLPKDLVQREINNLQKIGVKIKTNMVIGKIFTVDELFEQGYKAVFIGTGAGLPNFMNIPGEDLNGVYSSNEFLTRINLMKAYEFPNTDTPVMIGENVAVVGGGNVAMDAARSAKRLGAKNVSLIYRRTEEEMPARREEIQHAKEEGIKFCLLTNPISVVGNEQGWVTNLQCIEMELGKADSSGRRSPIVKQNSEFLLEMDTVIIAIGQTPNPLISSSTTDLTLTPKGLIQVDSNTGATSKKGVFAGGDNVTGAATVIGAMEAGKTAAKAIDDYLNPFKE